MTLILTVLSKDDVYICADKRNVKKYDDGRVEYTDDQNKIYKFTDVMIAICNHGVNELGGVSWRDICSDYEQSKRWDNKNMFQITADIENFMENTVSQQLEDHYINKRDDALSLGLVICGRTNTDSKFSVRELFWHFDAKGLHSETSRLDDYNLLVSGDGEKYLVDYYNSDKFKKINWKKIHRDSAENKLKDTFLVALREQKNLNGNKISDEYIFESLNSN